MLPVYKTSVLVSVLKDTFPPSADVWLLIEENIIQDCACLDLDRYWSKTHFLRPLVGDSIRSNLVIPHIAILPHIAIHLVNDNNRSHLMVPHIARDDVLLIETLPEYWQL